MQKYDSLSGLLLLRKSPQIEQLLLKGVAFNGVIMASNIENKSSKQTETR